MIIGVFVLLTAAIVASPYFRWGELGMAFDSDITGAGGVNIELSDDGCYLNITGITHGIQQLEKPDYWVVRQYQGGSQVLYHGYGDYSFNANGNDVYLITTSCWQGTCDVPDFPECGNPCTDSRTEKCENNRHFECIGGEWNDRGVSIGFCGVECITDSQCFGTSCIDNKCGDPWVLIIIILIAIAVIVAIAVYLWRKL